MTDSGARRTLALAAAILTMTCATLPARLFAQETAPDSSAVTPPPVMPSTVIPSTPLVSRRMMTWLGVGTLISTTLLMPVDGRIAHEIREFRGFGGGPPDHVAAALNSLGDPGTVLIPATLFTAGLIGRNGTLRDIGLHAAEAVALSGGITAVVKGVAGRRRPAGVIDADDFGFNKGFRGQASFPSGHTTAAFALATILVSETHRLHPGATMIAGIAGFGLATGVGFARVYTNHHWPSDVALGAGIGTITALAIDRMAHASPGHAAIATRLIPHASVALGEGNRTNLVWSVPLPR